MKEIVVDIETTIRSPGGKSDPFDGKNFVVAVGLGKVEPDRNGHWFTSSYSKRGLVHVFADEREMNDTMYIGHNIGFDLRYLYSRGMIPVMPARIWDTQQVEYLLSGQDSTFASLDDLCGLYGLPLKDDKIKKYWEMGVDTSDIPRGELLEYLEHDVRVTRDIYLKQREQVNANPKLRNLVQMKMDDILCTTMMEINGMAFDLDLALKYRDQAEDRRDAILRNIRSIVERNKWPEDIEFQPTSGAHVSAFLFGGTLKREVDAPILDAEGKPTYFKTGARKGLIKTRKETKEVAVRGVVDSFFIPTKSTIAGVCLTNDAELKRLHKIVSHRPAASGDSAAHDFIEHLIAFREVNKEISTYYIGYASCVSPNTKCIHPSMNHCVTKTGRMSSSNPNLQNVTRVREE